MWHLRGIGQAKKCLQINYKPYHQNEILKISYSTEFSDWLIDSQTDLITNAFRQA